MRPTTGGSHRFKLKSGSSLSPKAGRLPTGQPPGTAILGLQPVSLPDAEVHILTRPMTGIGGITKAHESNLNKYDGNVISALSNGYTCQVHDKNFYLGIARTKIAAIEDEIDRLKKGTCKLKQSDLEEKAIEKDFRVIIADVRDLEGKLADQNLALDKIRCGIRQDELFSLKQQLETKVQQAMDDVDEIFLNKKKKEEEIIRSNSEIRELLVYTERFLHGNNLEIVDKLEILLQNRQNCSEECDDIRHQLEAFTSKRNSLLAQTSRLINQQYVTAEKQVQAARTRLNDINFELSLVNLSTSDAHKKVLERVKHIQSQTKDMEKAFVAYKNEMQGMKDQLKIAYKQQTEAAGKSYELQNNQLMTQFFETFEQKFLSYSHEKNEAQTTVIALLEHISEGLISSKNQLPNKENFEEFKNEITFKKKELETSKETSKRLNDQKLIRIAELKKVNNLEERIHKEIDYLIKQKSEMSLQMKTLNEKEFMKESTVIKDQLIRTIQMLRKKLEDATQKSEEKSFEIKQNGKYLKKNSAWLSMKQKKEALKQHEQNIFSLKEMLTKKEDLAHYRPLKNLCFSIAENINNSLIKTHS